MSDGRRNREIPIAPAALPQLYLSRVPCMGLSLSMGFPHFLLFFLQFRASSGLGRQLIAPHQLEVAAPGQHRPGDAGKLVGEPRRRQGCNERRCAPALTTPARVAVVNGQAGMKERQLGTNKGTER